MEEEWQLFFSIIIFLFSVEEGFYNIRIIYVGWWWDVAARGSLLGVFVVCSACRQPSTWVWRAAALEKTICQAGRHSIARRRLHINSRLTLFFLFIFILFFFFFLYRLATCCMVVLFGYNSSTDFLLLLCVEKVFSLGWKTRKNKPSKKREWRRNWKLLFLFAGKWETYKKARAPTSELIDRHHSHGAPHLVWRGGNPKCNSIFLLNRFFFFFFFYKKWKCPFHWHCSFCTSPTNVSFDHVLHYVSIVDHPILYF